MLWLKRLNFMETAKLTLKPRRGPVASHEQAMAWARREDAPIVPDSASA